MLLQRWRRIVRGGNIQSRVSFRGRMRHSDAWRRRPSPGKRVWPQGAPKTARCSQQPALILPRFVRCTVSAIWIQAAVTKNRLELDRRHAHQLTFAIQSWLHRGYQYREDEAVHL